MTDSVASLGKGQSTPEYATVLLRMCGIQETWSRDAAGQWVSSAAAIRANVEAMVDEIIRRVVYNVQQHRLMEEGEERVRRFLAARD